MSATGSLEVLVLMAFILGVMAGAAIGFLFGRLDDATRGEG